MRKVIIFGNGLGRSLNNDYFNLQSALQTAWDDPEVLSNEQKQLIWQCLPDEVLEGTSISAPSSEEELDRLQRVLAACDEIAKCELPGGPGWLNDHGKAFPFAIRSYIHRAACYFHQSPDVLPKAFVEPLISHVSNARSHIATLNYDELLYRAFISTDVFSGYSCMIDGFVPDFANENLIRHKPSTQSFYLHLHGSPLYYLATNGSLQKSALSHLPAIQGHSSTHLVLTEVKHKVSVINASPILRSYWQRLDEAMTEASGLILFGYGGGDIHLNQMITRHFSNKQIEIVERRHDEYSTVEGETARFRFWTDKIGSTPVCHWHQNILDHTNWDWIRT